MLLTPEALAEREAREVVNSAGWGAIIARLRARERELAASVRPGEADFENAALRWASFRDAIDTLEIEANGFRE